MPKDNTSISCPKCGAEINVSDILYHQVQEQLKKEYEAQSALKDKDYQKKLDALQTEKDQIAKDKEQISKDKESFQQEVDSAVKSKINAEKIKLEKSISEKLKDETSEQIQSLEKELEQKSIQVKELNKTKSEIEKLKREKDELRGQVELEKEREFSEKLKDEKLKIQRIADESSAMQILELKKQLEDQKHLAEEMQRKAEQGSMQLQGEVQELALEEILGSLFPFDNISPVGKGVKGADVVHTVRNKLGVDCGTILYESKRTKSFGGDWISKLKTDAVAAKADICIIVSEALPDGIETIGYKDGVWICSFNNFKGLALVLRESLIKINDAYSSQTNKGEKMQMLYDYLISTEFRNQVGAIVEGFSELQQSYIREKQQMEKIWKQREKQLEKVLLNTNHFIGSIQGIAGSSLPNLQQIGEPDTLYELAE
ncbi:MAG: DUF2130 domain-containing protein [bacterium]